MEGREFARIHANDHYDWQIPTEAKSLAKSNQLERPALRQILVVFA